MTQGVRPVTTAFRGFVRDYWLRSYPAEAAQALWREDINAGRILFGHTSYVLYGYLRAETLFKKFTLFLPLSHPLILASPVFAISSNVIALYLCAFRISESRTAILKIYTVFTPESPSDFGIINFCDIKECNCATFMCFLCDYRISKTRYFKNRCFMCLSNI